MLAWVRQFLRSSWHHHSRDVVFPSALELRLLFKTQAPAPRLPGCASCYVTALTTPGVCFLLAGRRAPVLCWVWRGSLRHGCRLHVGLGSVPRVPLSRNGSHPGQVLSWPVAEAQEAKPDCGSTSEACPHPTPTAFHGPMHTAPPELTSARQGWTFQSSALQPGAARGGASTGGSVQPATPAEASLSLPPSPIYTMASRRRVRTLPGSQALLPGFPGKPRLSAIPFFFFFFG